MNAYRCDDCNRVWYDHETVTIKAKSTQGQPVEIRFCPMSTCDGKVQPFAADRRCSDRKAA